MTLIDPRKGVDWDFHQVITAAATMDWDANEGSTAYVKLTSNSAMNTPTNTQLGETLTLIIEPEGFTLDLSGWGGITWTEGAAPDVSLYTLCVLQFTFSNTGSGNIIVGDLVNCGLVLSIVDPVFPAMTVGVPITPFNLVALNGDTPYSYSVLAGSMPTGVSLNTSTGEVSGTPTVAGSNTVSFRVTDNNSDTGDTALVPWTVSAPVLSIADPTFPSMSPGVLMTPFFLSASNGTAPYTYSIQSGSLPTGVSLNPSTGEVSGTPTTASTGNVTFRVTDNVSDTADTSSIAWSVSAVGMTRVNAPVASGGCPNDTWNAGDAEEGDMVIFSYVGQGATSDFGSTAGWNFENYTNGTVTVGFVWRVVTAADEATGFNLSTMCLNPHSNTLYHYRKNSGDFTGIDVALDTTDESLSTSNITTTDNSLVLALFANQAAVDYTGVDNGFSNDNAVGGVPSIAPAAMHTSKEVNNAAVGVVTASGGSAAADSVAVIIAVK